MRSAAKSALIGQLFFYSGLLVCAIIRPEALSANDGISYFGIYRATVLPYALGLLGAAYYLFLTSTQLAHGESVLRLALQTYALLVVGIVVTPYAAAAWLNDLHVTFGATLFSLQLCLSGYLVWRSHYDWRLLLLAAVQFGAGVLSATFLNPSHGFELQTQVLFQLAFGMLLVLSFRLLPGYASPQPLP